MTPDPIHDAEPASRALQHSYPEIAAALRVSTDAIMAAWCAEVKRAMPTAHAFTYEQVLNDLPLVLDVLAGALEQGGPDSADRLKKVTPIHGGVRFTQGYRPDELLAEYRILRPLVIVNLELALGRRLTTSEDLAVDDGIDVITNQASVAYIDHQRHLLQSAADTESKYLSFMSHDLRNNLNMVTLYLQELNIRFAKEKSFVAEAENIGALQQSIMVTVEGMDRMLRWERLKREASPLKLADVDLRRLAEAVQREFELQASSKGLAIAVQVPQSAAVVRSDPQLVTLVLQNLLGNAVKFSPRGTTITMGAERQGDAGGWSVWVADQGPGIPADQLDEIFVAFRRGTTHGESGMGLGLAVAAQAAKLLAAQLTVESEVGKGSKFTLYLPARA